MESKGGRGDCKEENKEYHAYSRSILLFEVVSLEEEERKCQQKVLMTGSNFITAAQQWDKCIYMYLWFCRFEESAFINSIFPSGIVSGGGMCVFVVFWLTEMNQFAESWMHGRFSLFQLEADLVLLYGFKGRINLRSSIAILYSLLLIFCGSESFSFFRSGYYLLCSK